MTDQTTSETVSAEEVIEAMKDVIDPELGINIVDLGLVYGVTVEDGNAVIDMTLTSAACPLTDLLEEQTFAALDPITESHRINWVWMPPWGLEMITEEGREQLRAIGFHLSSTHLRHARPRALRSGDRAPGTIPGPCLRPGGGAFQPSTRSAEVSSRPCASALPACSS